MKTSHGSGRSIRFYLMLSYAMFVLIGLSVVGMAWFARQDAATDSALLLQMKERARLMASLNNFEAVTGNDLTVPETTAALNQSLRVLYLTPDLTIQRISDLDINDAQRSLAVSLAKEARDRGYTVADKVSRGSSIDSQMLFAAAPIFDAQHQVSGLVCLILPLQEFREITNRLRLELIAFASILAALGLLLGYGLAAMFSLPVKRAGVMAARVADGDYSVRLPRQGPDELVDMADHLNRMAEDLESQSRLRSLMLANVSHELSRPLGALRLGVDSLLSGAIQDDDLANDLLAEMSRTVQGMSHLVDDLDLASRAQQSDVKLEMHSMDLAPLLRSIHSRFRLLADSRETSMKLDLADKLPPVVGDEFRLTQVFGNLVDNALKFTPAGGLVSISVKCDSEWVEVSVADSGVGIAPEDLPRVFEPFFQAAHGQVVNRGVGLGLPIVQQLINAHGGQVWLENRAGGGTVARVRLRVAHDAPPPG